MSNRNRLLCAAAVVAVAALVLAARQGFPLGWAIDHSARGLGRPNALEQVGLVFAALWVGCTTASVAAFGRIGPPKRAFLLGLIAGCIGLGIAALLRTTGLSPNAWAFVAIALTSVSSAGAVLALHGQTPGGNPHAAEGSDAHD